MGNESFWEKTKFNIGCGLWFFIGILFILLNIYAVLMVFKSCADTSDRQDHMELGIM